MGNWRTVRIVGTCAASDLSALRRVVSDEDNFHCLGYYGVSLMGIGNWPAQSMDAVGNLAERDYSVEDVRTTLEELAKAAPTLALRVHCGGELEDTACIATVTLVGGVAVIGPPLIEDVGKVTPEEIRARMMRALGR